MWNIEKVPICKYNMIYLVASLCKINLAVRFPRNTSLMLLEKASCSTGLYLNIYLCYIKPVSSLLANTLDTGLMNARDSVRTMDNVVYTAFIVIAYRSGSIFLMQWD
jgi:hypothetical protein